MLHVVNRHRQSSSLVPLLQFCLSDSAMSHSKINLLFLKAAIIFAGVWNVRFRLGLFISQPFGKWICCFHHVQRSSSPVFGEVTQWTLPEIPVKTFELYHCRTFLTAFMPYIFHLPDNKHFDSHTCVICNV